MSVYDELKQLTTNESLLLRGQPDEWLASVGIDVGELMRFCFEDAMDTLQNIALGVEMGVSGHHVSALSGLTEVQLEAIASMLAMHQHVGIMLGYRLAQARGVHSESE